MAILAPTLSSSQKALEGFSETRAAFQGLTDSLSEDKIQDWKRQEKQALRQRGDAVKIYEVQQEKVFEFSSLGLMIWMLTLLFSAITG